MDKLQGNGSHSESSLWWCDTLCVLVEDIHKHLRKQAIRDMKRTYQDADKVLALDSGLAHLSKESIAIEIYIRIKLSGWMRRLWTLQEGLLAKDVYFQLSDGPMKMRNIDRFMGNAGNVGHHLYTRYSFDSYASFGPFFRGLQHTRDRQLHEIWKLLQWHSTSHQFDETLCLATILGIDPGPLLEIPQEDLDRRMIQFLKTCITFPLPILFQQPPRLAELGFRWASKSLLACFRNAQQNAFLALPGAVEIGPSDGGVFAVLEGLRILLEKSPLPLIGDDFTIRLLPETPHRAYRVRYIGPVNAQTDKKATNIDGSMTLKRPAIVLGHSLVLANQVPAILVDLCDA
jgi:hypothetical protein